MRAAALALLAMAAAPVLAGEAHTLRVDYYHTGDADSETFSLHRVVREPLPWPGHPAKPIDDLNLGHFRFQVEDAESGEVIYSRGYSSIFQEWQHTGEAKAMNRTFHESVRFPDPERPIVLRVLKRNAEQAFDSLWTVDVDPGDMMVVRAHAPPPAPVLDIHVSGAPADKVDIAILGDGYTADEADKFAADARRLTDYLFSIEPFDGDRGTRGAVRHQPAIERHLPPQPLGYDLRRVRGRALHPGFRQPRFS